MTVSDFNDKQLDNEHLDRRLRALHADAIDQVSAATMAQLHRRRQDALAGKAPRGFGWPVPAAIAATLAVAIGLGLGLGSLEPAAPGQPPAVVAQGDADALEDALDGLDQNPDFYAWLASSDAELLAME